MTASQILGVLFLMAGTAAMALRRDGLIDVQVASAGSLLIAGVACLLVGAIFLLLGYLQRSVET